MKKYIKSYENFDTNIILNEFPNLQIIENDRTTIKGGLEIDLHIPSKNVAIELNGPCHYIPIFGTKELEKTQNKDLIKQQNTSELIMKYLTSIDILFTIENDKGKIFI